MAVTRPRPTVVAAAATVAVLSLCWLFWHSWSKASAPAPSSLAAEPRGPVATGTDDQAVVPGTTFLQAVKDQLGLKLKPAKIPLEIPVVDHVAQRELVQ
jgi:uncharacterized protein (TIGR03435 family)